ncbi:hypothetical protein [Cohnella caldifontis]|uniref:hypothetical protein n=1 Tax=Cohnella caldifontis TaxID=3027471 RepID=UPI0023ECD6EF|nr:hypothetical protein [Cohnella sp. YIM B05605]
MNERSLQSCIVGFFDILGFRELTQMAERDFNQALGIIRDIEGLFQNIRSEYSELIESGLDIKMFSDNVCLSFPYDSSDSNLSANLYSLIEILADIQINMVFRGFPIRGGIALGMHYASENIIFSTGLVRAYETESKIAIVPRIVCHPTLTDVLSQHTRKNSNDEDVLLIEYLDRDVDNFHFINYLVRQAESYDWEDEFFGMLEQHKEVITKNAREHQGNIKVLSKYYWLAEYHNRIADPEYTDERYLIDMSVLFPETCKNPLK